MSDEEYVLSWNRKANDIAEIDRGLEGELRPVLVSRERVGDDPEGAESWRFPTSLPNHHAGVALAAGASSICLSSVVILGLRRPGVSENILRTLSVPKSLTMRESWPTFSFTMK